MIALLPSQHVAAAAQHGHWAADPTTIDSLHPDGEPEPPQHSRYSKDAENGWVWGNHPDATADELQQLQETVRSMRHAFAFSLKDMPGYSGELGPAEVTLTTNDPVWTAPRRYSPLECEIRDSKCQEQLDAGIISEVCTRNKYASAPTMPGKKDAEGNWTDKRFCVDYRGINDFTAADRYAMPLPEEIFQQMLGARFFSKLDLRAGFHQIPLSASSKALTAFWWGPKLYQYERMPFGLRNATAIFQRRVDHELQRAGLSSFARAFVDDIIIYSCTMAEHIQHVQLVLQCLHDAGLRAHPDKSVFAADSVQYLGHLVTGQGLKPDAAKVAAMQQLPVPSSADELRSQLGLLNYYRCYIENYALIAQPLYQLRKGAQFQQEWGQEQQQAYDQLKAALTKPGRLLRPLDPDRPVLLHTDWSQRGIAAVLGQLNSTRDKEYMVACVSRSLNVHERNYEPWKGELLAVVWGIKTFRPYLHGRHFTLHTDHRPLLWLLTDSNPTGQQARWVMALQEYDFDVLHRPGVRMVADVPSRWPLPSSADSTGARLDKDTDPLRMPLPIVQLPDGKTLDPSTVSREQLQQELAVGSSKQQQGKAGQAKPPEPEPACVMVCWATACTQSALQHGLLDSVAGCVTVSAGIDGVAPSHQDLCEAEVVAAAATADRPAAPQTSSKQTWVQQRQLAAQAAGWVEAAVKLGQQLPAAGTDLPGRAVGEPDQHGVRCTQQLRTASVARTFFPAAEQELVVYEPFGGLCAGLKMVLRNGYVVSQYLYSDIDPAAQRIAQHRIQQLMQRYPSQLTAAAVAQCFLALPQDVRHVHSQQLVAAGAKLPRQWLVVCGWECQDLSPAKGSNLGIKGPRSSTIHEVLRIVGTLQQLQPRLPPAYLIENVPLQHNWKSREISTVQHEQVCSMLGQPVVQDAAQFGSLAHRVRAFWSNLCTPQQLAAATAQVVRQPGLKVQSVLGPGRQPAEVQHADQPPRYPCNQPGQPMAALPTLVAKEGSWAFKPGRPGLVHDSTTGKWDEPTAAERERAMGYATGSTAAPGISEQQRRAALGRCMDANNLQSILAIAQAWWHQQHSCTPNKQRFELSDPAYFSKLDVGLSPAAALVTLQHVPEGISNHWHYASMCVITAAAQAHEQVAAAGSTSDIWEDQITLQLLQHGSPPAGTAEPQRSRARKRLQYYQWKDGQLRRIMADGSRRLVPRPAERQQLIKQFHAQCGHFGVRRTAALVLSSYWWHGVMADVAATVNGCELCHRTRASFNTTQPILQPLPIRGMFYRWGVDLCGPFPKTAPGNAWIMVAIEHYSKHLELVPLPTKEAKQTAAAFAHAVLGRFGSSAEVLTDQDSEWEGEFDQLLQQALIDHRVTSAHHPQADGLAERAVQTVKRSLSKLCEERRSVDDWDTQLPWLALGYRCSPQKSTGFSPYQLLYARVPTVPPAIVERLSEPLDFDDPEAAAADLLRRQEAVKQAAVIAGDNLRIAQHRDTLRYARVRDGSYLPRLHRFAVGAYVYVQRQAVSSLQIPTRPLILRVLEVRPSGVLLLQGRDARTITRHVSQCAPCHLPDIDGTLDYSLTDVEDCLPCEVCGSLDDDALMLACDRCNTGWHTYCLDPPLAEVPTDDWLCSRCLAQGRTVEDLAKQRQVNEEREAAEAARPAAFHSAATRKRDRAAQQLDGRLVISRSKGKRGTQSRKQWGMVVFRGPQYRPRYFHVYLQDGQCEEHSKTTISNRFIIQPEGTALPDGITIATAEQQL